MVLPVHPEGSIPPYFSSSPVLWGPRRYDDYQYQAQAPQYTNPAIRTAPLGYSYGGYSQPLGYSQVMQQMPQVSGWRNS